MMAPPTDKKIVSSLRSAVLSIFKSDRDSLTVRKVRDKVADDLELKDDFFVNGEWKERSKQIIKSYADELIDAAENGTPEPAPIEEPTPKKKAPAPVDKGTKRGIKEGKAPPAKRQRKQKTPSEASDHELSEKDESELSLGESDAEPSVNESDTNVRKPNNKPAARSKEVKPVKEQSKPAASSDEDDESLSDPPSTVEEMSEASPPPKKKQKKEVATSKPLKAAAHSSAPKKQKADSESDDEENAKPPPKSEGDDVSASKAEDSDSDMSLLIDEAPGPKKKRSSKGGKNEKQSSKPKTKTISAPKPSKDLNPDETLIRTLQSQLKKCGVKKIFQFELKKYGDDSKAKIKHLQSELRDVGMVGRFSEARAREIKEQRELMADLEAVKEGDEKWGMESGKRASRAKKKKNFRESPGSDDENGEADEGQKESESEGEAPEPRRQRARQDLAFLDDDDDDDSD